jgi:hypothetical protein
MEQPKQPSDRNTSLEAAKRTSLAVIAAAVLISVSLLVLANEVRFQGCRSLASEQAIAKSPPQECSRLPFGA